MSADERDDADTIEGEIERTQDEIGDTVERIGEKLSPNAVTRSLLGDEGQEVVREIIHMARDNPIPSAMVAIGAIWLVATSDSPLFPRIGKRLTRMISGEHAEEDTGSSDGPSRVGPPPPVGDSYDRARRASG